LLLLWVPTTVSCRIRKQALSPSGGNRSTCPEAAIDCSSRRSLTECVDRGAHAVNINGRPQDRQVDPGITVCGKPFATAVQWTDQAYRIEHAVAERGLGLTLFGAVGLSSKSARAEQPLKERQARKQAEIGARHAAQCSDVVAEKGRDAERHLSTFDRNVALARPRSAQMRQRATRSGDHHNGMLSANSPASSTVGDVSAPK
jgi:hypothetical protein